MKALLSTLRIFIAGLMSVCVSSGRVMAQTENDPHRPACTSPRCKKIKTFLKAHYCGASPAGNGPDDGCEIKYSAEPGTGVEVRADFTCDWNTTENVAECEQHRQPSLAVRNNLLPELRKIGLPERATNGLYYRVWESPLFDWSVVEAYYSHSIGSDIELCQLIALVDKGSNILVLRKQPFQKTDADVPAVTQWSLIDLVDVDGQVDVILEGDAYEDHWLEVVSMHDGDPETIFSGLGYYL